MADLHLNLIGEYFSQIKTGDKKLEYRLITPRFTKIIEGKDFNNVQVKWGYPKRDNKERILLRPWKGYFKTWITHEHFGKDAVEVYAIIVN